MDEKQKQNQKEYYKKWVAENRESRNEDYKRWAEENPSKMFGFRLPESSCDKLNAFMAEKAVEERQRIAALPEEERSKAVRRYTTDNGRASVQTLLVRLLSEEVGEDLSPAPKEKKTPGRKKKSAT